MERSGGDGEVEGFVAVDESTLSFQVSSHVDHRFPEDLPNSRQITDLTVTL